MSASRVGVGVIGAGMISAHYLKNMTQFPDLNVLAIADANCERARSRASEFGLVGMSVDDLVGFDEIEIVLNLTPPAAHFEVSALILRHGKHVWSEKPLATRRDDARTLLAEGKQRALRVACAPDTILGGALQTAQRAVVEGRIGEPVSAIALMQSPGPEWVHPDPQFFYDAGGGPILDTGPYYVTALVQAMGAIRGVRALSSTASTSRTVVIGPRAGASVEVRVPTQFMALLEFESGAIGTLLTSFESGVRRDVLEFHGRQATLAVPNPTRFEGQNTLVPIGREPEEPLNAGSSWGRGLGVLDLARSIRSGSPERASGELAYHVLDVLLAIQESAVTGGSVSIGSAASSPQLLPQGWDPAMATLAPDAPRGPSNSSIAGGRSITEETGGPGARGAECR
jgi:predicted dehydrogenase